MGSIRMYTGDDGTTKVEEINPSEHPSYNTLHDASKIIFRAQQPGFFSDSGLCARCSSALIAVHEDARRPTTTLVAVGLLVLALLVQVILVAE